jgi:hypothetical protein
VRAAELVPISRQLCPRFIDIPADGSQSDSPASIPVGRGGSENCIDALINAHFGMMRFLYMIRVTLSTKIL